MVFDRMNLIVLVSASRSHFHKNTSSGSVGILSFGLGEAANADSAKYAKVCSNAFLDFPHSYIL